MTDTVGFSVGAVARRLGVAPSTLRTWNRRYGIGARELSPGRHRRYTAEDIIRLEHMQKLILRGAAPADAARAALTAAVAPGRARPARTAAPWPGQRTGRQAGNPAGSRPPGWGVRPPGAGQRNPRQGTPGDRRRGTARTGAARTSAARPGLPAGSSPPRGQGRVMAPEAGAWPCPARRLRPAGWPARC